MATSNKSAIKDHTKIYVELTDTGVGIDPKFMKHIWESFSQADATITRCHDGTGLGLSICKHLVTINGGELGATSELGKGSRFWFTWNVRPLPTNQPNLAFYPSARSERVLVIDPVPIARNTLVKFIDCRVKRVDAFDTVEEGVASAKIWKEQHDETYNLIFFNICKNNPDDIKKALKELRSLCGDHLCIALMIFCSTGGRTLGEEIVREVGGRIITLHKPIMHKRILDCLYNSEIFNSTHDKLNFNRIVKPSIELRVDNDNLSLPHIKDLSVDSLRINENYEDTTTMMIDVPILMALMKDEIPELTSSNAYSDEIPVSDLVYSFDWSSTPLGPIDSWSPYLRTMVGQFQDDTLLLMNRDGHTEECYFSFTLSPIFKEDGTVGGVFNAVQETTQRVLVARRLKTLGELGNRTAATTFDEGLETVKDEEVEELTFIKGKLTRKLPNFLPETLDIVDLQADGDTPLTLMLSPLEESIEVCPPELSILQKLQMINRNARRLLKLVDTLLQFSRIESGKLEAQFRETDIVKYTLELTSCFEGMAKSLKLDYLIQIPSREEFYGKLKHKVFIDRDMYEKILFNLCSNAFKYTWTGSVTVRLYPDDKDGREVVMLEICDTGVGILEKDIPNLFQRFYRVESNQSRSYEGTGIGLALVKELVIRHGGEISVHSEVKKGTAFRISLPTGWTHLPENQVYFVDEEFEINPLVKCPLDGRDLYLEESHQWIKNAPDSDTMDLDAPDTLNDSTSDGKSSSVHHTLTSLMPSIRNDGTTNVCENFYLVLIVDDNTDMRCLL
ncbi:9832_t:CDS:2 [Acaulospora colombiana]|uniref:9832_t:CDS:1 n=1 Tax=Acaulospora colombiana TaxID=27376 RepID=A0ACA9K243_9GLOM|nr:9832_t:CDS:2 [Acaulospora colombiana]